MSTSTYIYIFGENNTKIWGLTGRERLQRMLSTNHDIKLVNAVDTIPEAAPVLFLNANFLFDARVITAMLGLEKKVVLNSNDGCPAAIRSDGNQAVPLLRNLNNNADHHHKFASLTLSRIHLSDLNIDVQKNLKKKDPPYIFPISDANRSVLENELFSGSYKGVTDLVTKWVWPVPAFWTTQLCVRHGWQPNHVTYASVVFAVLAGMAFWYGWFAIGLLMGWFMTFLDTVDGKLARVTVTSSKLGDILDHGLDIIHPPLWYLAWGAGLATTSTPISGLGILMVLMFIGYVGGRICEGIFHYWLAHFDMFIWERWDSFNRLITARRNPNLILLTYGWLIDQPALGLVLVVIWHLISTSILGWRLLTGWRIKQTQGTVKSWLEDIDPARDRDQWAVKIFTRAPLNLNNTSAISIN